MNTSLSRVSELEKIPPELRGINLMFRVCQHDLVSILVFACKIVTSDAVCVCVCVGGCIHVCFLRDHITYQSALLCVCSGRHVFSVHPSGGQGGEHRL